MREIKFRAWDRFKGEMVELTLLGLQWTYVDELTVYGVDNERGGVAKSKSDKVPVMQYTGLKDKNGKEIYEGDVVSTECLQVADHTEVWQKWHNLEVLYLDDIAAFVPFHEFGTDSDYVRYEVIGNIYEHPELLEAK